MALTAPGHASPERLAFNFGTGTVPGRGAVDRAIEREDEAVHSSAVATPAAKERSDWGFRGLLIFTAVLLVRPQDLIPGLDALHLAELSAIGAVAAMLVQRLTRGLPVMRMTPEAAGLLALGAAILMSVPFSIWPTGTLVLFTDAYLKVLIVFVLMVNTLTTPKRLAQIMWLMVLCCGYVAALSVVDYLRGVNLVEGNRLSGAVGGIFGNPNDLAMNMVAFLPAAAVVALGTGKSASRRLVAAVAAALMLVAIVATKSRGGGLGFVAMLLTLMIVGRRVRPGFAAVAVLIVVVAAPFMPASFVDRMASILSDQTDREQFTGSRSARTTLMFEGIQTFAERPLTGVGAGQFPNYDPPLRRERWRETHNALLQVAAETGIFGLLAFGFLIVRAGLAATATRRMLERPRGRGAPDLAGMAMTDTDRRTMQALTAALTAGLVGWFVCSLFASVAYNWTFYYLLALVVAARELTRARLNSARVAVAAGRRPAAPRAHAQRRGFA